MQRVQTFILLVLPPEVAILTIFKLGSQRLLVLLCAWDTLFPVTGPFPQISHTLAIVVSLYRVPCRPDGPVGICSAISLLELNGTNLYTLFYPVWQVISIHLYEFSPLLLA